MMSSIIVAGNGVSLREVPRDFLESRPLFGMNYLPYYSTLKIDYWTAWDVGCLEDNIPQVKGKIILPAKHREWLDKNDLYSYDMAFVQPHPPGRSYPTSMLWAIDIIDQWLPGYNQILVVGFDCTVGSGTHEGKGKGAGPHFYDPDCNQGVRYAESWDRQMEAKRDQLEDFGKTLVNISPGSQAKMFPPNDWRDYV